jgi:hypothetical protein
MTAGLPPPRLVTGYGWQRPIQGRLAHVVPNGETKTLCGLVTARNTWSIVLGADLINGISWCQTCGKRASQESHAANAANGRVLINGRRSPAEVRRVLASLDDRMSRLTTDTLARLDNRMSTTDRRVLLSLTRQSRPLASPSTTVRVMARSRHPGLDLLTDPAEATAIAAAWSAGTVRATR